jgi:asparagine synthase (glutamine-hydrolysing)
MWKPILLMFGHLPEPYTTLKDVHPLEKGEWFSLRLPDQAVKKGKFYKDDFTSKIFLEDTALEEARDILPSAVQRHLISDAPIGLFLSGGIDSSLLTLLAAPVLKERLQTLSIKFEESNFSEEAYQKIVIDITKAKHASFTVSQKDFEAAMPDISEAMDQPSIDAINTYFISMYARKCGLKAVLSGLGADELFGGYPSFYRFKQWRNLKYIPSFILKGIGSFRNEKLAKLSHEGLHPMLSLYLMNRGLYSLDKAAKLCNISPKELDDALSKITLPPNINYNSLNANSAMEANLYMKNQLLKDSDYMGMWHGIEIRVPFLDKEVIEMANSIDPSIKFNSHLPKSLLIEAFSTLLPAEIWNRKKQGFTFPFAYWLKQSEMLKPSSPKQTQVYDKFRGGKLHWSRYWAVKVAGI